MVAFIKYPDTVEQMWKAVHNFASAGMTCKAAIHTDAPSSADDELADLTQITGSGYTNSDTINDMTETSGTATWIGTDVVWTAGDSNWTATARYVSLFNEESTTDKLVAAWDYGATFALGTGETFTLDFGASVGTLV